MRHLLFTSSQLTGQNLWIRWKTKILMYYLFLSDPSPIIALPCQSVTESVFALVETWLMWPWRMQPLLVLPAVVSFDIHVVDVGTNKSHIADVRTSQKPCYHQFLSDPSLWQCFVCNIDKIPWKTVQRFWRTAFHLVLKNSTPETRTLPCSGFCKIGSDSSSKAPPFQSVHSSDCQGENWEGKSEKKNPSKHQHGKSLYSMVLY